MDSIKSFDVDLGRAFVARGSIGAAIQIAKVCFGLDVAETATAADLLEELRRPDVQALIEWRQDQLLSEPRDLGAGVEIFAFENQSCWQAVQRSNASVEIGNASPAGWATWGSMDLADFLLRLLAVEVVVGTGPCITSDDVQLSALRPFELLSPVVFAGEAGLLGVVAADSWFGVFVGDDDGLSLYASPAENVRSGLESVAADASWIEL